MKLILLRHAEAEPYRADDYSRRLTEKGIAQAGRVGTCLAAHQLLPDVMLTSPVIRARETAQIVAKKLQEASEHIDLTEVPWLACGMSPQRAIDELAAYAKCDCVLIVGHEPDFSSLVAALIGLRSNASMDLSKASLTAIDLTRVAPGNGILRFFLPVKLL